ncbi:MAG: LuxR C-terminal-related transcriptional regulator [Ketobacteraceae bacterium]|nr:LuxR C-terminal-related transcriptional regulator [Ketobacteraceae bacterium]
MNTASHFVTLHLSRGESEKALRVLESLPENDLIHDPELYMDYIWALLCERKFEQARIAREFFEANSYRLLADRDSDDIKRFATNAQVLSLLQFIFENDLNAISAEAMERVKDYLDTPSDYRFMITNIYAFLLFMNGRYEKSRFFAVKAKMANARRTDLYNYTTSTVLIALSDRALGRYDLSIKGIDNEISECAELDDSPAFSILLTVKAMLLYDRNDLEEARLLISNALPRLGLPAITEFMVHGYLVLARIEIWEQRYANASRLLEELVSKLDAASYQRWYSAIHHEQMRNHLYRSGDAGDNAVQDMDLELNFYNSRYCPAVGHIPLRTKLMVALHHNELDMAGNLLGQLSQVCLLQRDSMLRIVLLSSTAVLEFGRENHEEACEYLNQALRTSQGTGIIRALFDEVTGFGELFHYALEAGLVDHDVDQDLVESLRNVDFRMAVIKRGKRNPPVRDKTLEFESLTQTEQKILLLLCQGLPNKTIASQCEINISTVKWHLKNIYSKLYVRNRTEAVLKAQQHNLLADSTA